MLSLGAGENFELGNFLALLAMAAFFFWLGTGTNKAKVDKHEEDNWKDDILDAE